MLTSLHHLHKIILITGTFISFTLEHTHTIQEHLYHVLENNRAPCSSEVIPPDPNAPELPPPLEPDSQDNATPPVYQDITELSCKPNKLVDCDKSEQQCQHGEHLLNTDDDTVILTDEKVQFF